ncbi:Seven transmembrane MLO family protein [Perilla frutescens var. frutescens]|nr:Seven transmembrane MLO family protein [Perilla frutescens var. frutescens]
MAANGGRTLEVTPTWAVAVVCLVLLAISIVIEYTLNIVGKWLAKKNKRALYEVLEKVKSELMLLGFISLLLTVGKGPISEFCISKKIGNSWHPCNRKQELENKKYQESAADDDKFDILQGKVPFVSSYGIHQLHIFIFVLAVFHVVCCIITVALGKAKMRRWKSWEKETTAEYQYSHDPRRFRFARDTSFGRRHMSCWSRYSILLWVVCFFRQFVRSVPKVDYVTLRHGFTTAHLPPASRADFDFHKYIKRTIEQDFSVIVGISPPIWVFAVLFLMFNTHGWFANLWLPFIPLIIILLVGTKLQVIITKMGLRIQERGEVVRGDPVVQPGDDLFWFNRPRLLLYLIHFVSFQNAFQLALFTWAWYEFSIRSCFHEKTQDAVIRLLMGVMIQILCSYVTLPLYALVTQMGSNMKPTIFNEQVVKALHTWHQNARKQIKKTRLPGSDTPMSSRHSSPLHGLSPAHLLQYYKSELDSINLSPANSISKSESCQQDLSLSYQITSHEEIKKEMET